MVEMRRGAAWWKRRAAAWMARGRCGAATGAVASVRGHVCARQRLWPARAAVGQQLEEEMRCRPRQRRPC